MTQSNCSALVLDHTRGAIWAQILGCAFPPVRDALWVRTWDAVDEPLWRVVDDAVYQEIHRGIH